MRPETFIPLANETEVPAIKIPGIPVGGDVPVNEIALPASQNILQVVPPLITVIEGTLPNVIAVPAVKKNCALFNHWASKIIVVPLNTIVDPEV